MAEAQTNTNNVQQTNTQVTPQQPPIPQPVQKQSKEEEARRQLFIYITEILSYATDLGLELVDLECPKRNECPVYIQAKRLVRKLKELKNYVNKMQASQQK